LATPGGPDVATGFLAEGLARSVRLRWVLPLLFGEGFGSNSEGEWDISKSIWP
jgi:hypothetical protein